MKRPGLVIASSVVLTLLSLLQILMALLMVLAGTAEQTRGLPLRPGAPPPPSWMPLVPYGLAAFCAGLAAWGIITAIGVFRLRRWARISILVIGGGMTFVAFAGFAGMLVGMLAFSSFAPAGATSPPNVQAMMKVVFAIIALFYAAIAAIGIFWLVYFNRQTARTAFVGETETALDPLSANRRPLLISVYAVLSLLGTALFIAMAFLPLPTVLFGVAFTGWKKLAVDLSFAGIDVAIGVGLWKMAEWARRLALGFLAFGGLMILAYLVRPELLLRSNEAVYRTMGVAPPAMPQHMQMAMYAITFGFSLLFMAAIAWMLHYYRNRFAPPAQALTVTSAQ